MKNLLQFWDWIKTTFQPHYQQEIEDYLAQSVDHRDLEGRINHLKYRGYL
jgi:hypothetical protein